MTPALIPDAPYHRLGSADRRGRAWLALLFIVSLLFCAAVLLVVGAAVAGIAAGRPAENPFPAAGTLPESMLVFGGIALLLPLVLLAVRVVHGRPAGGLSSVTGRLRWGWLARCLAVAVAATAVLLAGMMLVVPAEDEAVTWAGWRAFGAAAVLLLPLVACQSAAEEYVCRGWLLQAVGSVVRRPWLPIAVQAVVFATLHGWGTPWGFAELCWFGAVTGWLCVRTGGIEAAVALHVANNVAVTAIAAALGLLGGEETMADAPWQAAVVGMVVTTGYALVVSRWAARRRLATRSAPAPEPALALAA
jgi:membrane protease YdiL (CAAX protease family)